jgi:hypothetical protein
VGVRVRVRVRGAGAAPKRARTAAATRASSSSQSAGATTKLTLHGGVPHQPALAGLWRDERLTDFAVSAEGVEFKATGWPWPRLELEVLPQPVRVGHA